MKKTMKMHSAWIHGLPSLISLLGFVGIFTENKGFLGFFGFAVCFQYFFMESDEMMEKYMNKATAAAFYTGMVVTAVVSLVGVLGHMFESSRALTVGFAGGWAASVVVYFVSQAYYIFRENWRL